MRVDNPVFFKDSQPMPLMVFAPDIVVRRLVCLGPYKEAGSDGFDRKVLRTLAPFITEPLAELFNLSLMTADEPEDWQNATICPISRREGQEDRKQLSTC